MTKIITESIKCDYCNADLITHTAHAAKFSLQLEAINTNRNNTGITHGAHIPPPIDHPHHFCGFTCLLSWIKQE